MSSVSEAQSVLDVLPIYPDDDAPVREGYKVVLPNAPDSQTRDHAYFPDTVYGTTEAAYAAALDWATPRPVSDEDTANIIRIEIDAKDEERPDGDGGTKTVRTRRSTYGWQVRMRREGTPYSQFFNDNHFGGREGALKAAQHWRDLRDSELTRVDPKVAADRSRATRSQFGVPGLRVLIIDTGNGHHAPYLQASWSETLPSGKSRRKRKTLSLEKHDPQEVTARLSRMLVLARGADALPSTEPFSDAPPSPDVRAEAKAFAAELDAEPPRELSAAERQELVDTFAELYGRAWPGVQDRLPAARDEAARLSKR